MHTETLPAEATSTRRWASIKGAANYAGTSPRTIHQLIEDGYLPAYRLGPKLVRIDLDELDQVAMRPYSKETAVNMTCDDQAVAALQVLAAVKANVIDNDSEAMLRMLRGSGSEVSLRLAEATNLLAHLVKMSDRPEQMLAALVDTVTEAAPAD